MKKLYTKILLLILTLIITGCGSSMYHYHVKPTPIKKGKSMYTIRNFELTLDHGSSHNLENKTFKTESELEESFKLMILKELSSRSILGDENSLQLDISIYFLRRYSFGGNALIKPHFDYTVKIYDSQGTLLLDYEIPRSITKYSYFKDIAVNAQITTFTWDAEDEPQDVELISKGFVKRLSELGE